MLQEEVRMGEHLWEGLLLGFSLGLSPSETSARETAVLTLIQKCLFLMIMLNYFYNLLYYCIILFYDKHIML